MLLNRLQALRVELESLSLSMTQLQAFEYTRMEIHIRALEILTEAKNKDLVEHINLFFHRFETAVNQMDILPEVFYPLCLCRSSD